MSALLPEGNSAPQFRIQENGERIAYHFFEGKAPCVVFLHGLMSDMDGGKALAMEAFCRKRGQAFLRFDAQGHGQSDGLFKDGCLSRWAADTVDLLDHVVTGPVILIGSSMGGWNMVLSALLRPKRVVGLLGIAAAPDFTEDMMKKDLSEAQLKTIMDKGFIEIPSDYSEEPYVISKTLLEDGAEQLVLRKEIELNIPVRLIHGMQDADVPWQTSLKLQEKLKSQDVEIILVKKGDHRLSTEADLARLEKTLDTLLRDCQPD